MQTLLISVIEFAYVFMWLSDLVFAANKKLQRGAFRLQQGPHQAALLTGQFLGWMKHEIHCPTVKV